MISDMVVVDAVVHPYDLALPNQNPAAKAIVRSTADDEFARARSRAIPPPWIALRRVAA